MGIELRVLGWTVVLGVVQLLLASATMTGQRGLRWNAGPRDGEPPPLSGLAGRLQRALANFLETFPLFAAAVLAVLVAGRQGALSACAVQVYLWARIVYVPLYAAGVPYLRSLVWVVSMLGVLMLLWALLR